jgi:hypothetical protein
MNAAAMGDGGAGGVANVEAALDSILETSNESNDDEDNDNDAFVQMMMELVDDDEDNFIPLVVGAAQQMDDDVLGSWGGSQPGKAPNKQRDFEAAYQKLKRQYFNGTDSVYDEGDFARRFRMPRQIPAHPKSTAYPFPC